MPTVILMDASLSMSRLAMPKADPSSPIELTSSGEEMELLHVGISGVNNLLDYIESNCSKMEYVALIQFSSVCELVCPFTRNIEQVRAKLQTIACQDKSSFEVGLQGCCSLIKEEWGTSVPINLVVVTDGSVGHGPFSLHNMLTDGPTEFQFPVSFPLSMSVVSLSEQDTKTFYDQDLARKSFNSLFEKLGLSGNMCSFHDIRETEENGAGPGAPSAIKRVELAFKKVAELHYKQWIGKLEIGSDLVGQVQLCPPPKPYVLAKDFEVVRQEPSDRIVVKGFLSLSELGSPPAFSRHLVLPYSPQKDKKEDESKVPNICVFLHGALKVENTCCLIQFGEDWYGFIYSWSDTKKKSSLMMSLFDPGVDAVPWLGRFNRLGPASELNDTVQSPFPVKSDRKPSYSSNPVVWIKQTGIQSDIQKVLRHARKLPDKTSQFYKELNRLKRAAVCFGFYELLEGVAQICERECGLLPPSVSPDCAIQLTHVAQVLRSTECYNVNHSITPRVTNFNAGFAITGTITIIDINKYSRSRRY